MAEKEVKPEAFSRDDALNLARKGKNDWNVWAEKKKNEGQKLNFSGLNFSTNEKNKAISFEGFIFPGDVLFSRAQFQDARFDGATFMGDAGFDGATFKGDAQLDGGTFTGPVSLENCQFRTVPDFRRSKFEKHVTLHGVKVAPESREARFLGRAKDADTADKYRRLKELAVVARDHDREQLFFARELKSKRGHETQGLARQAPNYFYELLSDFGRSLWRPVLGLFAVLLAFGNLYRCLASKDMEHIWDGLLFSMAQLFPFLGASKGVLAEAKVALFGTCPAGNWVNFFSVIEGLLGVVFIFLIGLALRNRFRI
jgi:hypothetical protein